MNVIVHGPAGQAGCSVLRFPAFVSSDDVMKLSVPASDDAIVVDDADLPTVSSSAWKIVGTAIVIDANALKSVLIDYASRKQNIIAIGGVRLNVAPSGQPAEFADVATDTKGQTLVNGAVSMISLARFASPAQPDPTFPWVNNDGSKLTLSAGQMLQIGLALGAFIQATYATLGSVSEAINAGTITSEAQIDASAWPPNS